MNITPNKKRSELLSPKKTSKNLKPHYQVKAACLNRHKLEGSCYLNFIQEKAELWRQQKKVTSFQSKEEDTERSKH